MHKIHILSVGKTHEDWLEAAIAEYLKRLSPIASLKFSWVKDDEKLIQNVTKEPFVICLDPTGKEFPSEQFSQYLIKNLENNGCRLAFVIGGAEGLPPLFKTKYPLISLSKMTFTHQITRLILIEQIYRAFEIEKGSAYHK